MDIKEQLKALETQIAIQICGGGYITGADADRVHQLRAEVGMRYDAVNSSWEPLDD